MTVKAVDQVRTPARRLPRRFVNGLRYLRVHGVAATWQRIFPRPRSYSSWVEAYDTLRPSDIAAIRRHIQAFAARPLLSVVLPIVDDAMPLHDTLASVTGQLYQDWELCVGADQRLLSTLKSGLGREANHDRRVRLARSGGDGGYAAAASAALATATGEFVLVLQPGDRLAAHALYLIAREIDHQPELDIIYSDEDTIDAQGKRDAPKFKCDWNPDLFLGCDLLGRLAAYRRTLVEQAGGIRSGFAGAEEYDLALRAVERTDPGRIRHIPMILYHARGAPRPGVAAAARAMQDSLAEHFTRVHINVTASPVSQRVFRIRRPLPSPAPGVSLIVPTRDHVDLLRRCVEGLLSCTDYDNVEIVVADNDSKSAEALAYLGELRLRKNVVVVSCPGPFNYSAINNCAAQHARHAIIGFVNNDISVIKADWLAEMVSHVVRPEIGAVGAKLLYPDDTIQHAGTVVGLGGLAGHAFRHFHRDEPGYLDRLRLVQNMSAVTAACMLIRKHVFEEAGGFDAVNLPVAYNDVDLCLRVRELGYRNLWTPFAELYHHESGSRASDFAPERIAGYKREMNYLKTRWREVIEHDPSYSPNLTRDAEDFALAYPPRQTRPWLD